MAMTQRRLSSHRALHYADVLHAIRDLEYAQACCRKLLLTERPVRSDIDNQALFHSAIMSYRKCFNSGERAQLNQAINKLTERQKKVHDLFIGLANQYVAHAMGLFEKWTPIVWFDEIDPTNKPSLGAFGASLIPVRLLDVAEFSDLIAFIISRATERGLQLSSQLQQEICGMSKDQLLALPLNDLHRELYEYTESVALNRDSTTASIQDSPQILDKQTDA